MFSNCTKAVFIGAHCDDEFICAGTLHRLARQGVEVHIVSFSPAATIDDRKGNITSERIVKPEWNKSCDIIGIKPAHRNYLGFIPSADFSQRRQEVCQYIYDFCELVKPDIVFTLSPDDENTAHRIVGEECERVMRGRVPISIRCQFPWNYSIGRGNLFVRLEEKDLGAKIQVIDAYQSQRFRYNYKEMLVAYARADGLSIKAEFAEKFELVRGVF